MESKEISVIQSFIKSIKDFEYYKQCKDEKNSSTIKYIFFLVVIYAVVNVICALYTFSNTINDIKGFFYDISELSYSDGILSIDNDQFKTFLDGNVAIDTSSDDYDGYATVFIGKEYCTINLDGNIFKIKYNDYFYEDINKEQILNMISNIGFKHYVLFGIVAMLVEIILLIISTLIDILIIAFIGFIMSKFMKNYILKFSQIFKITVHAITLSIVLAMVYNIINICTGFYIKYFSIMYTSIATIYMMTAIILILTDNNKKEEDIKI